MRAPTKSSVMPKPTPRTTTGKTVTRDSGGKITTITTTTESVTDGGTKTEKVTVRQKLDEVTKPLKAKLFGKGEPSSATTRTTTPTRTSIASTRTLTTPTRITTASTKTISTPTRSATTSTRTISSPIKTTTTTKVTVVSTKLDSPKSSVPRSTSGLYSGKDSTPGRIVQKTTTVVSRTSTKDENAFKTTKTSMYETPERRTISKTPLSEKAERNVMPRTPSEEALQDSCYHTHISLSKSSSAASMTMDSDEYFLRRTPSRDRMDLDSMSVGSGTSSSKGSEWYQEYKSQSFQNFNSKLERVLTRQEYDSHIAEIRGEFSF